MTYLRGIDVSGFQTLAQLAAVIDRYDWIGVKATEGLHSSNPLHGQMVALARSKGKGVLHYHFFHPAEDARAQWAWFKSFSQWRPGDMLALDLEQTDGLSWPQVAAQAAVFLTTGKADTGAAIWAYLNLSWKSAMGATSSAGILEGFPLWLADYTRDPAIFGSPRPWANLTCEQWTDTELGYLDGDVFLGDWSIWKLLAIPSPVPAGQAASVIPPALTTGSPVPAPPAPVRVAGKGDSMSHIEIPGGTPWREIPVPDDGRTYAVSLCFGDGPQTAKVEFLAFRRMASVTTPAQVARSGVYPAWQRDVPGRITLQPGEGAISIRFSGTPVQTLSVELYPVS